MNSREWLRYFEQNAVERVEPRWHLPSPLDQRARRVIARSLSHFQLGESGEGKFLLNQARAQAPDDAAYYKALALFIAEEKEHARLLGLVVRRFGGALTQQHWTHLLFRFVRRAFGLNFEIQVLVIAEIVGTAYYRLLQRRTCDPVLEEVCDVVLRDEAQHVAFHVDRLAQTHARLLPFERALWALQFQLLFTAAARVAWLDHRHALATAGATRREFFREARLECIRFLAKLDSAHSAAASPTAAVALAESGASAIMQVDGR